MKRYAIALLLISSPASAGLDYQCLSDCTDRNYTYAYCKQSCTVREPQEQIRPASPMDAYIRGREARQAEEARQLQVERMRAHQAQVEAETRRLREEQARREQEAAQRAKLEAENEALQQELERLRKEKSQQ